MKLRASLLRNISTVLLFALSWPALAETTYQKPSQAVLDVLHAAYLSFAETQWKLFDCLQRLRFPAAELLVRPSAEVYLVAGWQLLDPEN
jgi:hypothetical protein